MAGRRKQTKESAGEQQFANFENLNILERIEIFESTKHHFSSHTGYLFMF